MRVDDSPVFREPRGEVTAVIVALRGTCFDAQSLCLSSPKFRMPPWCVADFDLGQALAGFERATTADQQHVPASTERRRGRSDAPRYDHRAGRVARRHRVLWLLGSRRRNFKRGADRAYVPGRGEEQS